MADPRCAKNITGLPTDMLSIIAEHLRPKPLKPYLFTKPSLATADLRSLQLSNTVFREPFRRQIALWTIGCMPKKLPEAPPEFRNDREFVRDAVEINYEVLEYAEPKFKGDFEVVMAAVTNCGYALKYASKRLQDNDKIVMAAVEGVGEALEFASERLRSDREIVLIAVTADGVALEFAAPELRDDLEIVVIALKDTWAPLEFASETVRNVVIAAINVGLLE